MDGVDFFVYIEQDYVSMFHSILIIRNPQIYGIIYTQCYNAKN